MAGSKDRTKINFNRKGAVLTSGALSIFGNK